MGQLSSKIMDVLQAVQQLQVVTAVGKVTVTDAFDPGGRRIDIADDQKAMVTAIDLVQGDIVNALDEAFVPGGDDTLRRFHEKQVEQGNEIVRRNIRLLTELSKDIISIFNQEKESGMP